MRRRCRRNETRVGKQSELRERETAETPNGETIIQLVVSLSRVRECVRGEKEATVTVEVRENKLSTCQRIKALSCHILTRSHTHSSPQCLNLMSQVSLSGSCIPQHYHTAIITLCYRQFIALYSSASISIPCCHDMHPSCCHVLMGSPNEQRQNLHSIMPFGGWFLSTAPYSSMCEYTWVDGCFLMGAELC